MSDQMETLKQQKCVYRQEVNEKFTRFKKEKMFMKSWVEITITPDFQRKLHERGGEQDSLYQGCMETNSVQHRKVWF